MRKKVGKSFLTFETQVRPSVASGNHKPENAKEVCMATLFVGGGGGGGFFFCGWVWVGGTYSGGDSQKL